MELSSSVQALLRGLAQSGDSQVTDEIVRLVFDSLVVNSDKLFTFDIRLDEKRIERISLSASRVKDFTFALYTLISEAAKNDLDSSSVTTLLEDLGFDSDRIKVFLDHYENKLHLVRLFLSSSALSYPHIVGVHWRLDYCVKENSIERINEPVYLIQLVIERPNNKELDSIKFSCTIEQLQDLVYKLKEVVKTVEKLASE